MGRRGHGEGSIYQRKSDGKWVAYLRVNGKKKYFYADTRKAVADKLRKAQREVDQGMVATGPKQTAKQYLEAWLEMRKTTLKVTTHTNYSRWLRNRVIPHIGHLMLQNVSCAHIQSLQKDLLKTRLSPNSVRYVCIVLYAAFQDAVRTNLLARNPRHSSVSTTYQIYAHVLPRARKAAMDGLDTLYMQAK
jgi:integrase